MSGPNNSVIVYEGTIQYGKNKIANVTCYSITGLFTIIDSRIRESRMEKQLNQIQTK